MVTRSGDVPEWEHTTVLSGDLVGAVEALRAEPGNDLGLTGSISVCHQLLGAGVVDEVRLFTSPVVVGRGRRLFADGVPRSDLEIVDVRPFRTGMTFTSYRVV